MAQKGDPITITSNLAEDELATADKPGRKALKFCMWCGMKQGFWDRDYSSYHLIYDPQKEVGESLLQLRFMFFLRRKKTGGGKFNSQVQYHVEVARNSRNQSWGACVVERNRTLLVHWCH